MTQALFRALPAVDACLNALEASEPALVAATPRPLLRALVNRFLDGRHPRGPPHGPDTAFAGSAAPRTGRFRRP